MNRPRVLLADDHEIVAEGLQALLEKEFEVAGIARNGREMVRAAGELRPDVIVADVSMPHLNGIDALAVLKRERPDVKVVFLTMHRELGYVRRALDAGAAGFVLKTSAREELLLAVRAALQGRTFITPELAGEVIESVRRRPGTAADPAAALTPRQREILQLLAGGKSAKQIGAALGISSRTVEFHKYRAMEMLDIKSNAELIQFALKHRIAP